LRVTDFRWEQRLLAQSRLRLDLTQPLILRAISLPDVPSESRQLVRRQPDQLVSDDHSGLKPAIRLSRKDWLSAQTER
jgi:hypothetical protein